MQSHYHGFVRNVANGSLNAAATLPNDMRVKFGCESDALTLKQIATYWKRAIGFVPMPVINEAIHEGRMLVAEAEITIVGFVHFRCCKDGHATIYEIAVAPEWQGKGIGRRLVEADRRDSAATKMHHSPVEVS